MITEYYRNTRNGAFGFNQYAGEQFTEDGAEPGPLTEVSDDIETIDESAYKKLQADADAKRVADAEAYAAKAAKQAEVDRAKLVDDIADAVIAKQSKDDNGKQPLG